MNKKDIIWKDRKRTIFGLPLSFTVYTLTGEKILIDTGFLNQKQDEIMLFRITDITLTRTLGQRIFGLGTVHCCSADKTSPEFDLKNIKNSSEVKELLSSEVFRERKENRVSSREILYDDDGHDDNY
ncbi:MAG: PH domain-containing protein [Clostridia bacterium]|nr:PH domain-containing protein [Clostridia bacterium]